MAKNSCFGQIMEEGDEAGFFKILQRKDLLSKSTREIPHNLLKSISEKELSAAKMALRLPWGSSWPIKISRNEISYYMEKSGWEQFLSHNGLGNDEFLTFTHKGNMCFSVNVYQIDGKEMVRRPRTIHSSSGRNKEVKIESWTESSYTGRRLREKRELSLRNKKAEETERSKKKKVDTSSLVPEFTVVITKSYLNFLGIPKKFMDMHLPKETKMFKILHPKGNKSWEVKYMVANAQSRFSAGWIGLAKELDLAVGDVCKFKLITPTKMLLKVYKKRFHDVELMITRS